MINPDAIFDLISPHALIKAHTFFLVVNAMI